MSVDVSVIIVSYNTREMTCRCLRTVFGQTRGHSLEVIVVDNASADGSADMIAREFPQVRLVRSATNRGFAGGNNEGFKLARGRYVLLLNSDTEVVDDAIGRTIGFADLDAGIGVVGCKAVHPDGRQDPTIFRCLGLGTVALNAVVPNRLMLRSAMLGRSRYAGADTSRTLEVEGVAGCFMLVRREVLEGVGPLDEDFFMYAEEAEWCFRIRRAGWRIVYFPGATIIHHGGASAKAVSERTAVAVARSQVLLLQKIRGKPAAYAGNILMMLRDLPRAAAWCLSVLVPWGRQGRWRQELRSSASRFVLHAGGLFRLDWTPNGG